MPDPSIVTARIHGAFFGAQGASECPDAMTASSHGCFMGKVLSGKQSNSTPARFVRRMFGKTPRLNSDRNHQNRYCFTGWESWLTHPIQTAFTYLSTDGA